MELILIFSIWLTLFVPGHLFEWWIERIYSLIIVLFGFIVLFNNKHKSDSFFKKTPFLLIMSVLQLSYLLGFIYFVFIVRGDTGLRDYFDLLRYIFYYFFIIFITISYNDNIEKSISKIISFTIYFSVFISVFYLIEVPLISSLLKNILYPNIVKLSLSSPFGIGRFCIPFANPNFFAYFLNLSFVYFLYFTPKRHLGPIKFSFLLYLLFISGSRSGWIVFLITLSIWFVSGVFRFIRNGDTKQIRLILSSIPIGFVLIYMNFDTIMHSTRVKELVSAFTSNNFLAIASAYDRYNMNIDQWAFFYISPLIGLGPSKYFISFVIDNQFMLWTLRNGILGITIIVSGCFFLFYNLISKSRNNIFYRFGIFSYFVCISLFLLTGAYLDNYRLFFITSVYLASISNKVYKNHNYHNYYKTGLVKSI